MIDDIDSNRRTSSAITAGVAAGIFGLTGLNGLLFYIIIAVITSVILGIKCNFQSEKYFVDKTEPYIGGLFKDLLVFNLIPNFNSLDLYNVVDNHS
jgi:hypothetical protein